MVNFALGYQELAFRQTTLCIYCSARQSTDGVVSANREGSAMVSSEFVALVAVGFLAQLVDGALGMAFGLISTTALLTLGISPAQASAAVHTAEVFTTGHADAALAASIFHFNTHGVTALKQFLSERAISVRL